MSIYANEGRFLQFSLQIDQINKQLEKNGGHNGPKYCGNNNNKD